MIAQLWKDRYRHKFGSSAWLRSWAKRIHLIPRLMSQCWIQAKLNRRGVQVGVNSFVSATRGVTGSHAKLFIGSDTYVGRIKIAVHDHVVIGSHVCINDETQILSASHDITSPNWETTTSSVTIEDHAWIAVRCLILPGVTIGTGAVVGAGSVVSKDVAPYSIVVGNPAKPVAKNRPSPLTYSPVEHLALYRVWKSA
jgi:acetyltransferase-like isoleucine patch superfamily enzyme